MGGIATCLAFKVTLLQVGVWAYCWYMECEDLVVMCMILP